MPTLFYEIFNKKIKLNSSTIRKFKEEIEKLYNELLEEKNISKWILRQHIAKYCVRFSWNSMVLSDSYEITKDVSLIITDFAEDMSIMDWW